MCEKQYYQAGNFKLLQNQITQFHPFSLLSLYPGVVGFFFFQEYARETGTQPHPSKKYFNYRTLEEIIAHFPLKSNVTTPHAVEQGKLSVYTLSTPY